MKFFVKIYELDNERLIAVCDSEILGKRLTHNHIKLHVRKEFYKGLEFSEDEVLIELLRATSYNVIGKNICELLIKHDLVHPATILWIEYENDQVGHAITVR